MARIKPRRTKGTFVQARLEDDVKTTLQDYADKQGINLSELIRMTLKNLATVVKDPNRRP